MSVRNGTSVTKILRQWFFLIPGALVLIALIFCEVNKAYWDYRVDQWCEREGGVTIYETMTVSKKDYPNLKIGSFGIIHPFEESAEEGEPFVIKYDNTEIVEFFVTVRKGETSIIRVEDNKVLGTKTYFIRWGGDIWSGVFEASRYGCKNEGENVSAFDAIVRVKGE